jgi:drug/metabolite transporter (DMT)-like permease
MPPRPLKDWTMLLALVALWGSGVTFVKLGVSAVPPATLVAARLTIGAVILVVVVRALGHTFPPLGRAWLPYVVIALVGNCLPFWFITWGQQHIDSALAGILMGVMPLVTLILAHRFAPGERMTAQRLGGFALGFLGVVVLMGPAALSGLAGTQLTAMAQASVLCGAICYAANSVITRLKVRGELRWPPPRPLRLLRSSACRSRSWSTRRGLSIRTGAPSRSYSGSASARRRSPRSSTSR